VILRTSIALIRKPENSVENVAVNIGKLVSSKMKRVLEKTLAIE
jgi:hypothetical protein